MKTYKNPVCPGVADPFILYDGGTYYLYGTDPVDTGYNVRTSDDLCNWTNRGLCLTVADACGEPSPFCGFWAPEVHKIRGRYYMAYTVNEHIGIAVSSGPLGPFRSERRGFAVAHPAIDATLFEDGDGRVYLFYVGWGEVPYGIYGRTIDPDTLTLGPETPILYPDPDTWETREGYVTEGPFVIRHNGTYYLGYSGNGYESKMYAVGYAVSQSPLGPYRKYENNPILRQNPDIGVYGPGHHCLFYAAGGELMIAYHTHFSADSVHLRPACIDRVCFEPATPCDILRVIGPTRSDQPLPGEG